MDSEDCPTCSLYLPIPQSLQLVMSSSTVDPYCPTGQDSHTVDVDDAMNLPAGQHPKRPVDVKKLPSMVQQAVEEAGDKACHWPPHKVRVKPLFWNTLKKKKSKEWRVQTYN